MVPLLTLAPCATLEASSPPQIRYFGAGTAPAVSYHRPAYTVTSGWDDEDLALAAGEDDAPAQFYAGAAANLAGYTL